MSILPILAQAAEVANEPNWIVIGALIGLFAVLAIILLIPPKKKLTDADAEKKAIEAEPSESKAAENKEDLSLAEIKVAKREAVAADMSKEELRELRKERRAATQTDKAVHGRAETEDKDKENADDSHDASKAGEEVKADAETAESESDGALHAQDADPSSDDNKTEKESLSDAIDDVLTNASTDASDVFASLFGSKKDDSLDIFGSNSAKDFDFDSADSSKPANATVFPTLGSALIPLDELRKQSEESEADPLGELTKRLAAKAEKKTLT